MSTCMVCGHDDGACTGETREIVTVSGVRSVTGPVRVPKQNVRVGKAGYQGHVEIYDPKYPKLRFVTPEPELEISDGPGEAPSHLATAGEELEGPADGSKPAPKKRAKATA